MFEESKVLKYFIATFEGLNVLSLFVSIYHSHLVVELLKQEKNKHRYQQITSLFFGMKVSLFVVQLSKSEDAFSNIL